MIEGGLEEAHDDFSLMTSSLPVMEVPPVDFDPNYFSAAQPPEANFITAVGQFQIHLIPNYMPVLFFVFTLVQT